MQTDDFYELLGISRNASEDEIKRAYRQRARELHPDTNPDPAAEERFKAITLAYETLRDPERRRRYDMFGPEGLRSAAGPFNAGDGFGGGLGDLFDAFFGGSNPFGGGGPARRGPRRGEDAELVLELDFAEAVFGAQRELAIRVPLECETCGGSGARVGTMPVACTTCGGAGEIRRVRQSILGQMVTAGPCPACGGTGEEIVSPCPDCRGQGRKVEERSFVVEVPPGVDDGSTLRLNGRGAAGSRGGPPGDVYVHLRVRPDPRFVRAGVDLHHELHVAFTQAALGAELEVPTLDGPEVLAVPPGTQTGREFRLRGRGVPHLQGRGRGDLVVRLVVDTPIELSREQEELLRQLAAERGEAVAPTGSGLFSKIRGAFK